MGDRQAEGDNAVRARHAYLTSILDKPTLNIVLENDKETEILCIEITDDHLANIVRDGTQRLWARKAMMVETMR